MAHSKTLNFQRSKPADRRAFVLLEALFSAVVISILAAGMAGTYAVQTMSGIKYSHRMDAVNFARSAADRILSIDVIESIPPGSVQNPELSQGTHTSSTDPSICKLPDCFFTNQLSGKLTYNIDSYQASAAVKATRAEIIVEWDDKGKEIIHMTEKLYVIVYMHVNNPPQ